MQVINGFIASNLVNERYVMMLKNKRSAINTRLGFLAWFFSYFIIFILFYIVTIIYGMLSEYVPRNSKWVPFLILSFKYFAVPTCAMSANIFLIYASRTLAREIHKSLNVILFLQPSIILAYSCVEKGKENNLQIFWGISGYIPVMLYLLYLTYMRIKIRDSDDKTSEITPRLPPPLPPNV